jgi:hypothetical protein
MNPRVAKSRALRTFEDCLMGFFYYDRKEDQSLNVKNMAFIISQDIVTKDELIKVLSSLFDEYKNYQIAYLIEEDGSK